MGMVLGLVRPRLLCGKPFFQSAGSGIWYRARIAWWCLGRNPTHMPGSLSWPSPTRRTSRQLWFPGCSCTMRRSRLFVISSRPLRCGIFGVFRLIADAYKASEKLLERVEFLAIDQSKRTDIIFMEGQREKITAIQSVGAP